MEGVLKSYSSTTRYGFAGTPAIDGDVLVHANNVVGGQGLRVGQTIAFEAERTSRGWRAQKVKIVRKAVRT